MRGEFAPGSRVRDASVAELLGVSRTPVREAMLRLVADGLLESDLGRGFKVRPLTRAEAVNLAHIIAALECLALRLTDVFPDARLHQLDDINSQLLSCSDAEQAISLNDEWHFILLDGCPNEQLLTMLGTAKDAKRRYLHAHARTGGRPDFRVDQHSAVVDALRLGDMHKAEVMLTDHWTLGLEPLLDGLDGVSQRAPYLD